MQQIDFVTQVKSRVNLLHDIMSSPWSDSICNTSQFQGQIQFLTPVQPRVKFNTRYIQNIVTQVKSRSTFFVTPVMPRVIFNLLHKSSPVSGFDSTKDTLTCVTIHFVTQVKSRVKLLLMLSSPWSDSICNINQAQGQIQFVM